MSSDSDKTENDGQGDAADYEHLLWLCSRGMLYEVEEWLEAGHSAHQPPEAKRCPLRIASQRKFHSLVRLLLRYDCTDEQKLEALEEVARAGNMEICELLVEAGAPVRELHYWHLDEVVNRPLIQYLLDHGLDLTKEDGLAHMLIYRPMKPLLGLLMQNRKRFPEWEVQAAKALRYFVEKRNLKWISLMIWAKADPWMKVHEISETPDEEKDEDDMESAVEHVARRADVEIFRMLKVTPSPEQASLLLNMVWWTSEREFVELMLEMGADLNAFDPERGSFLHNLLRSFGWSCDSTWSSRDPRKEVECIAWAIRKGAKWIPPKDGGDLNYLRRQFYRGEGELVVEVIRLLEAGRACEKSLLRELVDKPKMCAWVRHHDWDLFCRIFDEGSD